MLLTVALGLTAAACWGVPDVWLAQATRSVGPFTVVFGSIVLGVAAVAPAAAFVDPPAWSLPTAALAIFVGLLVVVAYQLGFVAFRTGSVSIVTPIIACEGAVAAVIAVAAGEDVRRSVLALLPVAVLGVVLAGRGEGGGRSGALPAAVSASIWGVILVLSAVVADDLGVYWTFLLVRTSAVAWMLPLAFRTGAVTRWSAEPWRVSAWAFGDSAAYLAFVAAADRGPVAVASVLAAQFATVAVLVATVFFGERPHPRQLVGVALVIATVSAIAALGS